MNTLQQLAIKETQTQALQTYKTKSLRYFFKV